MFIERRKFRSRVLRVLNRSHGVSAFGVFIDILILSLLITGLICIIVISSDEPLLLVLRYGGS
jgi:hypothetical protein